VTRRIGRLGHRPFEGIVDFTVAMQGNYQSLTNRLTTTHEKGYGGLFLLSLPTQSSLHRAMDARRQEAETPNPLLPTIGMPSHSVGRSKRGGGMLC
jgi:hypothetical protein